MGHGYNQLATAFGLLLAVKLVLQARHFPFHSVNCFQCAAHRGEELAISPVERKGSGL